MPVTRCRPRHHGGPAARGVGGPGRLRLGPPGALTASPMRANSPATAPRPVSEMLDQTPLGIEGGIRHIILDDYGRIMVLLTIGSCQFESRRPCLPGVTALTTVL